MIKTRAQHKSEDALKREMDNREILEAIKALGEKITAVQTDTARQVTEVRTEVAASFEDVRQTFISDRETSRESSGQGTPGPGENNMSYDIRMSSQLPKFDGVNTEVHPAFFIEELDAHFAMYGVPERLKSRIGLGLLRGTARSWADVFVDATSTYEEFKKKILAEFWGVAQQREILHQLYQQKCPKTKEGQMAEYFMGWVAKARRLTPKMIDADIVAAINTHFKPSILKLLLTANCESVSGNLILLKKFDALNQIETQSEPKWTQNRGGSTPYTNAYQSNGQNQKGQGTQGGQLSWRKETGARQNCDNNSRPTNNRRVNAVTMEEGAGGEESQEQEQAQGNEQEGAYLVHRNPQSQQQGTTNTFMATDK
jgi:hypothetical protein